LLIIYFIKALISGSDPAYGPEKTSEHGLAEAPETSKKLNFKKV
jgi:hypothetical protein